MRVSYSGKYFWTHRDSEWGPFAVSQVCNSTTISPYIHPDNANQPSGKGEEQ